MPELDRHIDDLVQGEEDRDLNNDRQAASKRRHLLALVELHHLLLLLHSVVGMTLLDLLHLRLQLLNLAHRFVGLVLKREEEKLHDDRNDQDRKAKIANDALDEFKQPEQRLGEEIEPAPIDHQIEAVDLVLLLDRIDYLDDSGPGEQAVLIGDLAAGRHDHRILGKIVGLIYIAPALHDVLECSRKLELLIGDQRGCPVFVGEAQPAAG